jgi:hypothetical protein
MLSLQVNISKTQAAALFHLVLQIPAHSLRECADSNEEANAMREFLDAIRHALAEQGFKSP